MIFPDNMKTNAQNEIEFMRRMYSRELETQRKLCHIGRFLIIYAIAAAITAAILLITKH